ncbi:MAG: undecaprenyl-diphosphate phosphatase [Phycisphaeraceae bacterium]
MTWWEAIILGVVEGLTEYLPVSSTGHLLVVQDLLGIGAEDAESWAAANAYAICIQAGAIVAVLGLYWQRVKQGVVGMLGPVGIGKGDEAGLRLFINLVVAFIPAAVIGLIADDWIEANLFNAWTIVVAWFVGGVAILAVTFWKRGKSGDEHKGTDLDSLSWQMAMTIGFIQCLAMMPGTSRSLVTIVGGILIGMHIAAAVEFSFLLGVVTLLAATVYKAIDKTTVSIDGQEQEMMMFVAMNAKYGLLNMFIGVLAAWVSAVIAIKWMVSYLKKHGMAIFGYYRIAVAILVAALILTGHMSATTPQ